MKIYDEILNYEFLNSFNIHDLKNSLVLPIKNDGVYLDCFVCDKSKYDDIKGSKLLRTNLLSKDEILFFLSDFDKRLELFRLADNANLNEEYTSNYIQKFFLILLKKSIESRSSDIHIEALENSMIIRFRVDGSLKIFYIFQKSFIKVLSSYIKMLSSLEITNTRTPMDGRFSFMIDDIKYDFRVSTMPTINSESIVIRVLNNQDVSNNIKDLGFSKNTLESIESILKLTQGLVLISGPTGSGKSTTLYSILKSLNSENRKIITIEDPVEYKLQGIQQIEVNDDIGLSFDSVLRNILRQDPDVILIGEIRDNLSLKIALQASLTGHLVLASIHANDSVKTISRLKDLKADNYLLSTTLKYIISQRLVLNICKECKQKGCSKCNYSGFFGRSSLCEVLKIDDEVSTIILKNEDLKSYLIKQNFKTILDDGKRKVEDGVTTLTEVYKVIEN